MNIFLLFLHFFLNPQINQYSDEYIHLKLEMSSPIWELLDLMLVEYADKTEIIQKILKSMTFSLMMYLTREHGKQQNQEQEKSAADGMILRIEKHLNSASLGSLSAHFGYHPIYIYAMLHKKKKKKRKGHFRTSSFLLHAAGGTASEEHRSLWRKSQI